MAKTKSPTNQLAEDIINRIMADGGYAWKNQTTGIPDFKKGVMRASSKKGVSDILGIVPHKTFAPRPPVGQLLAIELKLKSDKLSDEQAGFLEAIKRRGGIAWEIRSFEQFLEKWQTLN